MQKSSLSQTQLYKVSCYWPDIWIKHDEYADVSVPLLPVWDTKGRCGGKGYKWRLNVWPQGKQTFLGHLMLRRSVWMYTAEDKIKRSLSVLWLWISCNSLERDISTSIVFVFSWSHINLLPDLISWDFVWWYCSSWNCLFPLIHIRMRSSMRTLFFRRQRCTIKYFNG